MKKLLIVFIVLLFLLTLLSSFGGSIRTAEPFYDATPAYTPESFEVPNPSTYETYGSASTMDKEYFYEDPSPEIPPATPPAPPSFVPETPASNSKPAEKSAKPTQESFVPLSMEKFDIPEPFTDLDSTVGAPF